VLVSEAMLQQTTVTAVLPYFERWMARFPDVETLSVASEEEVLAMWQGLGYYRRAKYLLACARLAREHGWPRDYSGWLALPGVGAYTAGAVCSICFDERVPAVDGNVKRVCARLHASDDCDATAWALRMADSPRPGDVNQALMDLGATVCRPKNPCCEKCPVRRHCVASQRGLQSTVPATRAARDVVELRHEYVVPFTGEKFGVRRFGESEWWSGMVGFPLGDESGVQLGEFTHAVTHHRVTASAVLVRRRTASRSLEWMTTEELMDAPMPAPHRRIFKLALASLQGNGSNATGTARVPSSAKK
jgi:A/G-specific adenine glycosylase